MACYDCDDCQYRISKGGKCKRFEYTCPYSLVSFTKIENVKEIQNKAKQIELLIESIKTLDEDGMLSDEISTLKNGLVDILEFSSEQMIEEWQEIIK